MEHVRSDTSALTSDDQGLIDLDNPEKSKILKLIQMGDADKSPAALIQAKVRQTEYEAFAEWIKAGARDPGITHDEGPVPAIGLAHRAQ